MCNQPEPPLPAEMGTTEEEEMTFALKPRPESGLDCLVCAKLARRRNPESVEVRHSSVVLGAVGPILATFDLGTQILT